ncbi:MAG TPA: hypothetical protein VHZ76_06090, partial [Gammaproteobacteria bacterium]|nr:hypothetical protein [Gammaproteobacteria bacterium]
MSDLQFKEEIPDYLHIYQNDAGFTAKVMMNARDGMVFGEIASLPDSSSEALSVLKTFVEIFKQEYGAKAVLTIAPSLLARLPQDLLTPYIVPLPTDCNPRYISREATETAIAEVQKKPHVAAQLEKFKTGEYKLLTKEALKEKVADLSEFKIKNASFVDKV